MRGGFDGVEHRGFAWWIEVDGVDLGDLKNPVKGAVGLLEAFFGDAFAQLTNLIEENGGHASVYTRYRQ